MIFHIAHGVHYFHHSVLRLKRIILSVCMYLASAMPENQFDNEFVFSKPFGNSSDGKCMENKYKSHGGCGPNVCFWTSQNTMP